MGRRKIRNTELDSFVRGLEEAGVTEMDIRPARVEGWSAVWWDDPGSPQGSGDPTHNKLFRWSLILILLGFTLAVLILSVMMGGIFESHSTRPTTVSVEGPVPRVR